MGIMDFITRIMSGGAPQVSPAEVQQRRNQKGKPFLLDVRQPVEFRAGHIPGAKLIPLNELGERLKELPKNQEIVVVCASGTRSARAARQLSQAGYTVHNMKGGMAAWSRAGLPVSKGN